MEIIDSSCDAQAVRAMSLRYFLPEYTGFSGTAPVYHITQIAPLPEVVSTKPAKQAASHWFIHDFSDIRVISAWGAAVVEAGSRR
ncbi:MAG: hypothetical protein ACRD18_01170 [Terriglobia bacterium]